MKLLQGCKIIEFFYVVPVVLIKYQHQVQGSWIKSNQINHIISYCTNVPLDNQFSTIQQQKQKTKA